MAPKNLPPAAKQAKILTWFQDSRGVYTLKELEKLLQGVASINGMQVKEHLQALQDENLIRVEKIGSGNWYWSFVSDAKKAKERTLGALKVEEGRLGAALSEAERAFVEETAAREADDEMCGAAGGSGLERRALMDAHAELLREVEMLDGKLAGYSDNDPEQVLARIEETRRLRESAMRWTDNIEVIESFLAAALGDRQQTGLLMAEACGGEYVVGEGLKEL